MHLALVIPNLNSGGAERMTLRLAQGLVDRGHRVDIVLISARFHYVKEVPETARLFAVERGPERSVEGNGLADRIVPLPAPAGGFNWLDTARALKWDLLRCRPDLKLLHRAYALASYMRRENPDCVLPSLPRAKTATLMAGRFLGGRPPIIPIIRNDYRRRRARDRLRLHHLAGDAAHFVGVSQGVSSVLASTMGVPSERITTVYNPVVAADFDARMAERPEHPWLLDGGAPVVVAAGRLERAKGFPTLIRAFARLASRRPCRLIIFGRGKMKAHLERLVGRLGLAGRVSLPGWVDNPLACMARASLFVLSSTNEGLPAVLVEALACGCPCVSTDCPSGPKEILQDGEVGPLVPVGDEVALAGAMERVLEDPPERRTLQQRAAEFSMARAIDSYERLMGAVVRPSGKSDGVEPRG